MEESPEVTRIKTRCNEHRPLQKFMSLSSLHVALQCASDCQPEVVRDNFLNIARGKCVIAKLERRMSISLRLLNKTGAYNKMIISFNAKGEPVSLFTDVRSAGEIELCIRRVYFNIYILLFSEYIAPF